MQKSPVRQTASPALTARIQSRAKFVGIEKVKDACLLVRAGAGDRQIIANHPWLAEDWKGAAEMVTTRCYRCNGTGTYYWGAVVNGRPSYSGVCFRCNGSGKDPVQEAAKPEPKKTTVVLKDPEGYDFDLNVFAGGVATVAKTADEADVWGLILTLEEAIVDPAPKGFPVAPNVYAFLLTSVREAYRIRFGASAPDPVVEEVEEVEEVVAEVPEIPTGTFTLEYPDGGHFTFRIKVATQGKLKGRTVIQYLSGPDNETAFEGFGFVNAQPGKLTVNVWKRYEGGKLVNRAREVEVVLNGEDLEAAGLAYAMRSSRCRRCNRVLTVPTSIHQGYGPECIGKI